ncbi:MAG: aspartate carbamoyltransferase regulatory subunit [Archaeoglobi archaeon]|nr:aspartate carbamoyltransferase regulatory subunit [Candidatus Mnemosynella bozhongmuii]MDK2782304.1 aspartate carbamoyltransferase regulatory subunit [Archaeoglobi archaeon]
MNRELRVRPIKDGTVIDHVKAGQALNVLRILGIKPGSEEIVSMVMNVPSKKMGRKDIVKVENRELKEEEVAQISLISPEATINIIRNYEVVEKYRVSPPEYVTGLIRCPNLNCISNTSEPVSSKFIVMRDDGIKLRCYYCERVISDNIADHLL